MEEPGYLIGLFRYNELPYLLLHASIVSSSACISVSICASESIEESTMSTFITTLVSCIFHLCSVVFPTGPDSKADKFYREHNYPIDGIFVCKFRYKLFCPP